MQQTRVSANCSCEHAQFSYDLSSLQCNCASAVLESPCVVSPPIPRPILSFRICSVPYFRPQFRSAPFREIVPAYIAIYGGWGSRAFAVYRRGPTLRLQSRPSPPPTVQAQPSAYSPGPTLRLQSRPNPPPTVQAQPSAYSPGPTLRLQSRPNPPPTVQAQPSAYSPGPTLRKAS